MDIKDWLIIGAVGFAWLNKEKLKEALNPGNDNNIFNTAANAALGLDNKTASIGTKANDLVTAILEPDKKYAGYPHKYDMKAGVAYVLFNGQWMVDTYETAKLKAEQKAKNSKPTIQVRRIGKSNQWEKLVSGKWTPLQNLSRHCRAFRRTESRARHPGAAEAGSRKQNQPVQFLELTAMKNKIKALFSSPLIRHALHTILIIALVRNGVITPDEARTLNTTAQHLTGGA